MLALDKKAFQSGWVYFKNLKFAYSGRMEPNR